MTANEMLEEIFTLIEEYDEQGTYKTDDVDLRNKIISVMNHIQNELARIKKISAYEELDVKKGDQLELAVDLQNFYQLNVIKDVTYEEVDGLIVFRSEGKARIYYYKYPKRITKENLDKKLELTQDVLEIMAYGVAADILKADVASNYGQVYATRYKELLNGLDPRYSRGHIEIEEGVF